MIFTRPLFWEEAFCDQIVEQRKKHEGMQWNQLSTQQQLELEEEEKNSAFGLLCTFAYQMRIFGVSSENTFDFINKWSLIHGISTEQIINLKQQIESFQEGNRGMFPYQNPFLEEKKSKPTIFPSNPFKKKTPKFSDEPKFLDILSQLQTEVKERTRLEIRNKLLEEENKELQKKT